MNTNMLGQSCWNWLHLIWLNCANYLYTEKNVSHGSKGKIYHHIISQRTPQNYSSTYLCIFYKLHFSFLPSHVRKRHDFMILMSTKPLPTKKVIELDWWETWLATKKVIEPSSVSRKSWRWCLHQGRPCSILAKSLYTSLSGLQSGLCAQMSQASQYYRRELDRQPLPTASSASKDLEGMLQLMMQRLQDRQKQDQSRQWNHWAFEISKMNASPHKQKSLLLNSAQHPVYTKHLKHNSSQWYG